MTRDGKLCLEFDPAGEGSSVCCWLEDPRDPEEPLPLFQLYLEEGNRLGRGYLAFLLPPEQYSSTLMMHLHDAEVGTYAIDDGPTNRSQP